MNTATFIRRPPDDEVWSSYHYKAVDQRIYRLAKPIRGANHVLVSAIKLHDRTRPSGERRETVVWGCDADGNDCFAYHTFSEMWGVFDHDAALRSIGCVPVYPICG